MATDQNSIPKDLRPLNIARAGVDEQPFIMVGRNMDGGFCPNLAHDVNSPRSRSTFYPATMSDNNGGYGGGGLGFVNPAMAWCSRPLGPAAGPGFVPNFVARGGGNAGSGSGSDQRSDEGGDDPSSSLSKKVKFLCSFGGKILPRPSDGMLRYVGGQTRIISVRRDVSFQELVQRMTDTCGQPVVFKYQLPDEDLDALVSVSSPEDLENMMDEYEKLVDNSPDGSAKLRVFLFSSSEIDSSGLVQLGDLNDSKQKYFEAVNGIPEFVGGGIMRRASEASATSTQNSDNMVSGGEVVDSSSVGQGPPSPGMVSPREGGGDSFQDAPTRLVYVGPNSVVFSEAHGANLAPSVISTGSSQTPSPSFHDTELGRPTIALGQQQQTLGHNFRSPTAIEFPSTTLYMQAYPHHEPLQTVDYPSISPQMGYVNPQVSGIAGYSYRRSDHPHQLQGNTVFVQSNQFRPSMQMTMGSSTAHMSMRPNTIQQFTQPNQTQANLYTEENKFGLRVPQLLGDQSYKALQPQPPLPHAPVQLQGGAYDWPHAASREHVVFSDGLPPHHQVIPSEHLLRLDDCHMCQKALPHAHSDTIVQDHRDPITSIGSDYNPCFQSLRSEDTSRSRPPNRVLLNGPLGEGTVENHGARTGPKFVPPMDHDVAATQLGLHGFPHNMHVRLGNDNDNTLLQNLDGVDNHRMFPATVVTDNVQSPYDLYLSNVPPSRHDDSLQQPTFPFQYQYHDKHEPLMTQPVRADRILPLQISDPLVLGPSEYSSKHPGLLPKEDISDSCIPGDLLRPIDGRMEAIRISPPVISCSSETNCRSPIDQLKNEEDLDDRTQMTRKDLFQTIGFMKSGILSDGCQTKPVEMLPSSTSEALYLHNLQPLEFNNPHFSSGTQPLHSDKIWHGELAFSDVDSAYATDRVCPVSEWNDEASPSELRMVYGDGAPGSSRGTAPTLPVSNGLVADNRGLILTNSLFSNQDPWNLRHDTHFPPPRPDKDPQHSSGILNEDLAADHVRWVKGSGEEQIKEDLQAVAEGVASSVLQSSLSSDLVVHDGKESVPGPKCYKDLEGEAQDVGKLPEKTITGLPISDGIGRLQIIKNDDLEELRELGSGTFGTVYHGKWRGSDVAIKRINDRCFAGKPSEQARMRDDFWNEAIKLADLHHPNVVAFYGVVLDGPGGSVATVTEYMVNGSLRQAFQRNDKTLDKRKRLLIAMDVAFGMEYLHGKNIVHFDLKSDNLLVNLRDPHRPICKVGDLGLSKVKCQTLISGGVRGTLPWMAPELLNGSSNLVSEKVDVFSFGIVMWELLTGEEPYADLHYGAIIGGIVSNSLRPPVPDSCDSEWRSLMERCWSSETLERPSFTEIVNQLRSMSSSLPPKGHA